MITIEDVVARMTDVLMSDTFHDVLRTIDSERNDGLVLEPLRAVEWEEIEESALPSLPCALIIGETEEDPMLRDQTYDATLSLIVFAQDKSKRYLTKRLYRYGEAVRRVFAMPRMRTLNQTVISVKIGSVRYSPTFTDRQVYSRDITMDIRVRMTGR